MPARRYTGTCTHPTADDHSRITPEGKRRWTCTACTREGEWGPAWAYWGNVECKRCWRTSVEAVTCSDACRAALGDPPSRVPPSAPPGAPGPNPWEHLGW